MQSTHHEHFLFSHLRSILPVRSTFLILDPAKVPFRDRFSVMIMREFLEKPGSSPTLAAEQERFNVPVKETSRKSVNAKKAAGGPTGNDQVEHPNLCVPKFLYQTTDVSGAELR